MAVVSGQPPYQGDSDNNVWWKCIGGPIEARNEAERICQYVVLVCVPCIGDEILLVDRRWRVVNRTHNTSASVWLTLEHLGTLAYGCDSDYYFGQAFQCHHPESSAT